MDTEKVDYTVFKSALSALATALTGKDDVLADDTLTEWAARKIKVFAPFGKDYAVLEVKARHRVGLNEETLGYVSHLALTRIGRVAELVEGITTRNGQVVSVKTEIDRLEIKAGIASPRWIGRPLPLDHVPPPPGPKPTREVEPIVPDREAILLRAGFSHGMLEKMSEETKNAACLDLDGHESAVQAQDFPDDIPTAAELAKMTRRNIRALAAESADIPY
jgi:hypothetical protein